MREIFLDLGVRSLFFHRLYKINVADIRNVTYIYLIMSYGFNGDVMSHSLVFLKR